MARAEVVYEDKPGAWRGTLARIEDMSPSGACIRVSIPISVGARLKIKWKREEFSGIAKYCRRDGGTYVLGVHRETSEPEPQSTVLLDNAPTNLAVPSPTNIQDVPSRQETKVEELPESRQQPVPAPISATVATSPADAEAAPKVANQAETPNQNSLVAEPSPGLTQESETSRRNEPLAREPSQGQERTTVFNKLLHLGSGRQHQTAPDGNGGNSRTQVADTDAKATREYQTSAKAKVTSPPHQGSLLSLQDIYLAVGIMGSRPGYDIDTVSAMLDSNHMRGMTSEVKKASVLMALEAAGIPVHELLQDGAKRQEALNAYEAGQRKRFEEYEERKSQESAQIQSEIERMTAHCLDRIKQNLGEVTQARDAFLNWQTTKEKETRRISEAVALFAKTPAVAVEQPGDLKPELETVGAVSKQ
jgi:hypothetical protein